MTDTNSGTSNKPTLAELDSDLEELGKQAGQGKDTQVKALLRIAEAAYHGLIDLDVNKHGQGVDDATKRAEKYVRAQNTSATFNAKAPNQAKLISTFRTMTRFGSWPKGGTGEPVGVMGDLMAEWRKLRAKNVKTDDAANSLLKFARAQLKRDQLIGQDELESFCLKKNTDHESAEDVLERTRRTLKKLVDGKIAGGAQDASTEVKAAIDAITKRLRAIAIARGAAKMQNGSTKHVQPLATPAKANPVTLAALTLV